MLSSARKDSGTALVTALFVIALVAALAAAIAWRLHFTMNRSANLQAQAKMYEASQAANAWASEKIKIYSGLGNKNIRLPLVMPALKIHSELVTATLYDAQSFFNVNNLADQTNTTAPSGFLSLLSHSTDLKAPAARKLLSATKDWVQADNANQQQFSTIYAAADPSYQAPHALMAHVSEFRLVNGVTANVYQALTPFLIALPTDNSAININTASAAILLGISPDMDAATVASIIQQRQNEPFLSVADFEHYGPVKKYKIDAKLTVKSQYFLLKTEVASQGKHLQWWSLLQFEEQLGSKKSVFVQTWWQLRGLS